MRRHRALDTLSLTGSALPAAKLDGPVEFLLVAEGVVKTEGLPRKRFMGGGGHALHVALAVTVHSLPVR